MTKTRNDSTHGTVAVGKIVRASQVSDICLRNQLGSEHPVLVGLFDSERFDLGYCGPTFFACGQFESEDAFGIQCRWQCGADVLYWFANAADPDVWRWIDQCSASGHVAVGAQFLDGRILATVMPFSISNDLGSFRSIALSKGRSATEAFRATAAEMIATGDYTPLGHASPPGLPQIRHVQGAMLRTQQTELVNWPLPPAHLPCHGQLLVPTHDGRDIQFYRGAVRH